MTITNLSEFGFRELGIAGELLTAMSNNGLPIEFDTEGVTVMFNQNSGCVFLTNSECQVCVLDGNEGLEMFYTTPYSGHEGTLEELIDDYTNYPENWDEEDIEFLNELKENK